MRFHGLFLFLLCIAAQSNDSFDSQLALSSTTTQYEDCPLELTMDRVMANTRLLKDSIMNDDLISILGMVLPSITIQMISPSCPDQTCCTASIPLDTWLHSYLNVTTSFIDSLPRKRLLPSRNVVVSGYEIDTNNAGLSTSYRYSFTWTRMNKGNFKLSAVKRVETVCLGGPVDIQCSNCQSIIVND